MNQSDQEYFNPVTLNYSSYFYRFLSTLNESNENHFFIFFIIIIIIIIFYHHHHHHARIAHQYFPDGSDK
jgi:hypothetical protein